MKQIFLCAAVLTCSASAAEAPKFVPLIIEVSDLARLEQLIMDMPTKHGLPLIQWINSLKPAEQK